MPHRSFGTERRGPVGESITFDFGLYGEETFTIIPQPSLGDTLDLYDVPEPTPKNELESVRALVRFIRRMLPEADIPRFEAALKRIPADQAHIVIDLGAWIAEQVSDGFPTSPAHTSSGGRQAPGPRSKRKSGTLSGSRK